MAHRNRLSRTAARSTKVWIGPAEQGYVTVADNTKVLLASTAGFGLGSAGTIVRTRGLLGVHLVTSGATLAWDGAFGIAVVSATALTTGITAIPGPFTDADWSGWFVHQFIAGRFDFDDSTGARRLDWSWEIDSKAMRKVKGDEAIVLVGESRSGAIVVLSHMRVLFQES